jgi:DNA-binding NarL/FixJ family response regulator
MQVPRARPVPDLCPMLTSPATAAPAIPLAIIEDQPVLRRAFETYLCSLPDFDCVLVAESVEDFLARLPDAGHPPRLVLSDIGLPGASGIEGIGLIRQQIPDAEVVMISVYQDADRVFQALCAGAVGYLVKNTPLPQIRQALLEVAAGGSPMSPAIARHVVRHFRPQAPASSEALSAREQQVVQAIVDGLSYKLIADRLGITLDTVRYYIRQIYRKLHVNSKAEVIARALRG